MITDLNIIGTLNEAFLANKVLGTRFIKLLLHVVHLALKQILLALLLVLFVRRR